MQPATFQKHLLHPRYWLTWFGFGILWLVIQLPYPVLVLISRGLSKLAYRLAGSRRRIVETNIDLCFPDLSEKEKIRLIKDNFFYMILALFESGMSWFWSNRRLKKLFTIEGIEHFDAVPEGQGKLMMAMHFTNLDIGGAFVSMTRSIDAMYRPHNNPVYDYVQKRGRERHGEGSITIDKDDIRGMVKALRKGKGIWYAPDQDYGRDQSVFVPFFGTMAATVTATTRFAKMGKATVLPMVQTRLPDCQGYKVVIYPPMDDLTGDELEDALKVNQFVETRIKEQPEQYLWAHRRFKTRPNKDDPPIYASKKKKRKR